MQVVFVQIEKWFSSLQATVLPDVNNSWHRSFVLIDIIYIS